MKGSIFNQINHATSLLQEYFCESDQFVSIFKSEQTNLNVEWNNIGKKYMLYLASQNQEAYDQYNSLAINQPTDALSLEDLPFYYNKQLSPFNVVFLVRRFIRNKNKSKNIIWNQKERLRELKTELKEIGETLSKSRLKTAKDTVQSINKTRKNIDALLRLKLEGFSVDLFLESLFIGGNTISKDEFLSIITVDKSIYTKEYIDENLSEKVDYRTLEDAIFIHKIEDENDEWMFDIFYDQFWTFRNAHKEKFKEIEDKLFDGMGLNQLPTYSVSFDEFGDVADIKQNPPKLKLITNNESPILDSRILH